MPTLFLSYCSERPPSCIVQAMNIRPPAFTRKDRIHVTTCALCGALRSRRYQMSRNPEPLICSVCIELVRRKAVLSQKVNVEVNCHCNKAHDLREDVAKAPQARIPLPDPPTKPIELPANVQDTIRSDHRNYRPLSPGRELPPPRTSRNRKPLNFQFF